jgi:hypothetical protein
MRMSQKAGKASGVIRAASAKWRQLRVLSAYQRLKPSYRDQPFSKHSLDEVENELRRAEQRRAALQAAERTLEPPLSDYESIVEVIEDPARVLQEILAENERKELSLEEKELSSEEFEAKRRAFMRSLPAAEREQKERYDALLAEALTASNLAYETQKKKKKRKKKTATADHSGRDRLIKDLQALGIRSKRSKKRSG